MFKLGGKTVDAQGTGITSGLDVPRQGYADQSFVQKLSEIDVSVPESTRKRAFWSGIGQGFGSNPRTLGEALNTAVGARDQILGPAEAKAAERGFELRQNWRHEKEFDRETCSTNYFKNWKLNTDIRVAQALAAESYSNGTKN